MSVMLSAVSVVDSNGSDDDVRAIVRRRLTDLAGGRVFVSIMEVASLLDLPRATAYDAVARGEIPTMRLGKRLRVPVARLAELLLGRELE